MESGDTSFRAPTLRDGEAAGKKGFRVSKAFRQEVEYISTPSVFRVSVSYRTFERMFIR